MPSALFSDTREHARRQLSAGSRHDPTGSLILDIQPPTLGENKRVSFKALGLWYLVAVAGAQTHLLTPGAWAVHSEAVRLELENLWSDAQGLQLFKQISEH